MLLRGASKKLVLMSLTPPHFFLLSPRHSFLRLSRLSISSLSSNRSRRSFVTSRPRLILSVRASDGIHTQSSIKEDHVELSSSAFSVNPPASHPWPEWTKLVDSLRGGGYFDREVRPVAADGEGNDADALVAFEDLPGEFLRAANACLAFACDHNDLLRFLSKQDIEVMVRNGSAFLFKNGVNSMRRLRCFLGIDIGNVSFQALEFEKAQTVDVMRFLLSYASSPLLASSQNSHNSRELVEASVRNLLNELSGLNTNLRESGFTESMLRQSPVGYGQSPRPVGQNIEMKRGDWICPKCSFMNFARNMKCLECNEGRPKKLLTGGEWECPQCDFFNYGRNTVCLRCDCKRPGETTFGSRLGLGSAEKPNTEQAFSGANPDKVDIESRLAANEEKAQRWFSKVSQLDSNSDMSSAIADEDFPEIMPLRKGVNRFVISTRKTPLERRLANAQYRRNLGNDGSAEGNDFQSGDASGTGSDQGHEKSISQSLDRILGHSSTDKSKIVSANGAEARSASAQFRQQGSTDPGYVPFVPLPTDMFAKPKNPDMSDQAVSSNDSVVANTAEQAVPVSENSVNRTQTDKEKEQAEKSERWFKKVAELHDVTDLASAISDEDFPEIMPMRKGEPRFVVPKKKDRSLTSPQYKRRLAMEQANSSNFVPFVPFPPDYFAKKDKNTQNGASTEKAPVETTSVISSPEKASDVLEKPEGANAGTVINSATISENQQTGNGSWNAGFSTRSSSNTDAGYWRGAGNPAQQLGNLQANSRENWNSGQATQQSEHRPSSGDSWNQGFSPRSFNASNPDGGYGGAARTSAQQTGNLQANSEKSWKSGQATQQPENKPSSRENWNQGFTGKSLEGSLVKPPPDPLDMSEEAKAERWFRRVAQIKDVSELSQIPDEDFPSIMPMRKGVNRFVVSKRKTPLERRLTSPQYRRNLPIVSSNPTDKDNVGDEGAAS